MRCIPSVAEWTYAMPIEGFSEVVFELLPDGMRMLGYDIQGPVREVVFAISYPAEVFDALADEMHRLAVETSLLHALPVDAKGFDAVFQLDPSRRVRITGNVLDGNQVRHEMFGAMYARADVDVAAAVVKKMAATALARSSG